MIWITSAVLWQNYGTTHRFAYHWHPEQLLNRSRLSGNRLKMTHGNKMDGRILIATAGYVNLWHFKLYKIMFVFWGPLCFILTSTTVFLIYPYMSLHFPSINHSWMEFSSLGLKWPCGEYPDIWMIYVFIFYTWLISYTPLRIMKHHLMMIIVNLYKLKNKNTFKTSIFICL